MPDIKPLWRRMNGKLFYKMIVVYSLLTVIPMITIISLFYVRTTDILEKKIQTSSRQTLVETTDKIDGILKLMEQQALRLSNTLPLNKILNNDFDPDTSPLSDEERAGLIEELLRDIGSEMNVSDLIDEIYVFNLEGQAYASTKAIEVTSFPALTYIAHQQEPGTLGWSFFTDHKRVCSALEVINKATDKVTGYIVFMLKPDLFTDTYSSYTSGDFMITNSNSLVLSARNADLIDTKIKLEQVGDDMVVNRRSSYYTGFTYISFLPKKELNGEITDLAYYAIGITLAAWLVVFILTFIILRHITKPLVRLSNLMRKAEREEFFQISGITTNDEIAQLCRSFNQLMEKIKFLIQQVYQVELLKKEADLKVVKMHLNPHFLYNTLESISIMARGNEAAEIPKMIDLLAKILRSSLMPKNDYVPLEAEIQLASSYLQLHKYRYKEKLQWSSEVETGLDALLVPKLILQPIVENAIKHGIEHVHHTGRVVIRAYEHQFDLVLEVEDSGPGFQKLNSSHAGGFGTGLDNVASRLRLLFGGKYGITITEGTKGGTVIRIRLPIMMTEREAAQ
ncbi:cache domain-containing sensor histidine kinase [Paenibacillus nasutitermitis]|uniref:histidine kinase n=1 Tax=Paenibacillus nasutitermitis TaxID=1652958 RepID=A0A916YNF5_9BACL|nr:sensor histidine kinase [Paenibacillus nasutitermitis]GGD53685.1 sensor histidine kinase YesM [Paenibacillus nasutitermitis]